MFQYNTEINSSTSGHYLSVIVTTRGKDQCLDWFQCFESYFFALVGYMETPRSAHAGSIECVDRDEGVLDGLEMLAFDRRCTDLRLQIQPAEEHLEQPTLRRRHWELCCELHLQYNHGQCGLWNCHVCWFRCCYICMYVYIYIYIYSGIYCDTIVILFFIT